MELFFNYLKFHIKYCFRLINFQFYSIFYFKFENKKNQIKVMAFRLNIIPRNI